MQANQRYQQTESQDDYAGQTDGVNSYGVPLIQGQNAHNAVQGPEDVLAKLGFSSLEEMMAAAAAS